MANQEVIDAIREELDKLRLQAHALQITLEVMSKDDDESKRSAPPKQTVATIDIDLSEAETLKDCLEIIGQACGEVNVTQAAHWVIEAGKSDLEVRPLSQRIRYILNEHPDFSKVGRGNYRRRSDPLGIQHDHQNCGDDCEYIAELMRSF